MILNKFKGFFHLFFKKTEIWHSFYQINLNVLFTKNSNLLAPLKLHFQVSLFYFERKQIAVHISYNMS